MASSPVPVEVAQVEETIVIGVKPNLLSHNKAFISPAIPSLGKHNFIFSECTLIDYDSRKLDITHNLSMRQPR